MNHDLDWWRYRLRLKGVQDSGPNARSARRVLEGILIRARGGYGCLHPWPELGDEPLSHQWDALHGRRPSTRLVRRALECCRLDGEARREGRFLFENLRVPESHATFLPGLVGKREGAGEGNGGAGAGTAELFRQWRREGFTIVKLKGNRGWQPLLETMEAAMEAGLRVRLDFNAVLTALEFQEFAGAAAARGLGGIVDFVEDPVPYDPEVWRRLADSTGWRLALDWLPEGAVEADGFTVRVLKPAVEAVSDRNRDRNLDPGVPVVFTSAMDHPVGQLFAAWEAARFEGAQLEAGLLTHRLFEADAFTEMLGSAGPVLRLPGGTGLGFDRLLESLPWLPLVRRGNRRMPGRVLQNPRDPLGGKPLALKEGEIGFPTSGSTGLPSVVVHTDDSLEASANAVNEWLEAGSQDVWLRVLPLFHVGGRQIHTRAELAGSRVVEREGKWEAAAFAECCRTEGVTLASLVPAQVFDLVSAGLRAPGTVRAVVAGGGALEPSLWRKARDLGWPVLPSYGASEAASQVATARISEVAVSDVMPPLELLPGWQARVADVDVNGTGLLELRGPALASARLVFDGTDWRRIPFIQADGGWWRASDRAVVQGRELRFAGRADRVVKVLGELVNPASVESALVESGLDCGGFAVVPVPDGRKENELVLVTEREVPDSVLERYAATAAPFARLSRVVRVDALPRSPLGKVRYGSLPGLIPPSTRG
ncbi:MAG: O-succinylbenzoate--CoA ligase [Verrucomicrobiales bacterium]|nr:O-succinylbenzoate--CoA ligase [Verrucomicrobiales bacterium]